MPVDERDLDDARRRLYRLPPEQFMQARAALIEETDDPALGEAIGKLRKATVPAWLVNAYVDAHPDVPEALADLGQRLAAAQTDLDTALMRELALERRKTVAARTDAALAHSDRADAGATIRQSVSSTFDAAIADPEIAARLGALQRPEQWSGFGVAPSAAAGLRLVRRGETAAGQQPEDTGTEDTDDEQPDEPDDELRAALDELAETQDQVERAGTDEDALQSRLRRLTTKLATLQNEIASVRHDLDEARTATSAAKRARRGAQATVDRLERRARRS